MKFLKPIVIFGIIVESLEEGPLFPKKDCKRKFLKKASLLEHAERPELHKIVNMAEFHLRNNEQNIWRICNAADR